MGALSTKVLNAPVDKEPSTSQASQTDASKLAKELNAKILRMYGKFLSDDGSAVDYDGISKSAEFSEWKSLLQQLHNVRWLLAQLNVRYYDANGESSAGRTGEPS
jgi:hypothetical protein